MKSKILTPLKSLAALLMLMMSVAFSSCQLYEPPPQDMAANLEGRYSIDGYIYSLRYPDPPLRNYSNLGLDIEWAGFNQVMVYIYTGYYYFEPFDNKGFLCQVEYNPRTRVYNLYNPMYSEMIFEVGTDGSVYVDFPYVYYNFQDCGYVFWGYFYDLPWGPY